LLVGNGSSFHHELSPDNDCQSSVVLRQATDTTGIIATDPDPFLPPQLDEASQAPPADQRTYFPRLPQGDTIDVMSRRLGRVE
jgi:hypothetical protein